MVRTDVASPAPATALASEREEAEELSDDEIQRLLREAEERLRAAAAKTGPSRDGRTAWPRLNVGLQEKPYIEEKNGIAQTEPARLIDPEQRKLADTLHAAGKPQKSPKTNDATTAGPAWFDLPKTIPTPALKRDLQVIEMRAVLDPHRHYKKNSRKGKIPTFSQTGTVIEGAAEWYSSRLHRKERARNLVEEAMATERETGRFKRKYGEIQEVKRSGKKGDYKKLMAKRKKKT